MYDNPRHIQEAIEFWESVIQTTTLLSLQPNWTAVEHTKSKDNDRTRGSREQRRAQEKERVKSKDDGTGEIK